MVKSETRRDPCLKIRDRDKIMRYKRDSLRRLLRFRDRIKILRDVRF